MEIKKEDVLKAHENGCSDVKNVLETLFPKAFKDKHQFKRDDIVEIVSEKSEHGLPIGTRLKITRAYMNNNNLCYDAHTTCRRRRFYESELKKL